MSTTMPAVLRRSQRIHVQVPVDIIVDVLGKQVRYEATTVDFSDLGVRVRSSVGLAPGTRVRCIVGGANGAVPSQVIWAAPPSAQQICEIGIQFLTPFPSAV